MKTAIIIILSIVLLLGVSLTTLSARDTNNRYVKNAITDVVCICGCGMKAIDCLCGNAMKALKNAGFSAEDIKKHLKSKGAV